MHVRFVNTYIWGLCPFALPKAGKRSHYVKCLEMHPATSKHTLYTISDTINLSLLKMYTLFVKNLKHFIILRCV